MPRISSLLYIIICAIMLGIIVLMYCPVSDDLAYSYTYADYIFHNGPFAGLGRWCDFFVDHAVRFNGRLGDKFIPLYMALPRWVMAICQAITAAMIFIMSAKIAYGNTWKYSFRTVVLVSAMVLLLPWYERGFLGCMWLNYQVALLLNIAWIYIYIYQPNVAKWYTRAAVILLSFCAGAWHESFSIIVIPVVLIIQVLREKRTAISYIEMFSYLVGIGFILSCPGFWVRFQSDYVSAQIYWKLLIFKSIIPLSFLLACGVIAVRQFLQKSPSRYTRKEWMLFLLIANLTLGTLYISGSLDQAMCRHWWFAQTFALIGWGMITRSIYINRYFKWSIVTIVSIVTLLHLSSAIYWQYQIKKEYDKVISAFIKSDDGVVYYDDHTYMMAPVYTLRKAQREVFMHNTMQCTALMHPADKILRILPKELEHIDTLQLSPAGDTKHFYKTPTGNLLYESDSISTLRYANLSYMDAKGQMAERQVVIYPIASELYPNLLYVKPHYAYMEESADIQTPISMQILR